MSNLQSRAEDRRAEEAMWASGYFDPSLVVIDNLDIAVRLAWAGISVFPCRNAPGEPGVDKRPLGVRSWTAESTTDEDKIVEWWHKYPDALVAIDCGKSGLVVIDADRHDGPDGVAAFDDLVDANGGLEYGPMTLTANNGQHHFFLQPTDGTPLGNSEGALQGRGINVRGAGGYVIAQGSMREDGESGWKPAGSFWPDLADAYEDGTIQVIPQWLVDLIRAPKQRDDSEPELQEPASALAPYSPPIEGEAIHRVPTPLSRASDAGARAWATVALEKRTERIAGEAKGGRNIALNAVAYSMGRIIARGWIEESTVRAALEQASRANGYVKDKGIKATRDTINSGLRAGLQNPHEDLPKREEDSAVAALAAEIGRQIEEAYDGTLYDGDTGEIIVASASRAANKNPDIEIEVVVASSFAGKPVPPQEFHVEGLIPAHNVTMLAGDGATGKSLLGLQLALATASGCSWIGLHTKAGKALFVSAEDELDEMHRRLARMCPRLEMLDNLAIIPLAGKDAVLAAPEGNNGLLKETPLFKAVRRIVAEHRPELLVLDTLADLFGGDEIKKVQARQFIAMLRGLALEYGATVLLLSHPSQTGMNSGTGTSGNTAWNNSVRSRLYLERRVTRDGGESVEENVNIRVLRTMKANRAASGGQIVLRYDEGLFVREEESALNARDAVHQAERVFMELLAQFEREDRMVSDKPGPNYAPFIFSKHPGAKGVAKGQLERAMNRLFGDNRISVQETGPMSRRQRKIISDPASDDLSGHADDAMTGEE